MELKFIKIKMLISNFDCLLEKEKRRIMILILHNPKLA